jgi:hypothetical protein
MNRVPDTLDDIDRRFAEPSRSRLRTLVEFAQLYRGWTGREAAAFLRRDVHNVILGSGVPKVDLILRLARALDWPATAILDEVCGDAVTDAGPSDAGDRNFSELNRLAYAAFSEGRFEDQIRLARTMRTAASTPEERATACLREYGGWDGLGRYEQAMAVVQRGLVEAGLSEHLKLRLRANLASTHFALGRCAEGEGVASLVVDRIDELRGEGPTWTGVLATALYVRGACRRSMATQDDQDRSRLGRSAAADLRRAQQTWTTYHELTSVDNYAAAAKICEGMLTGAQALAGDRSVQSAVDELLAGLEVIVDPSSMRAGWWREAFGWWCVVGADLILSQDARRPDLDQALAVFTNKGHELAEVSGHWLLRERVLTLEHLRRSGQRGVFVEPCTTTLDGEDLRALAGVMARFPAFRPLGWELVRTAKRID